MRLRRREKWGMQGRRLCLTAVTAALVSLAGAASASAAPGDATVTLINIDGSAESQPQNLFNANGTLLFGADTTADGFELWRSDGGPVGAGTDMITPQIAPGTQDSNPSGFAMIGETVFFAAGDGFSPIPSDHGRELWKMDPPYTTPVMVKDINTGQGVSSNPDDLTAVGSTLFFQAADVTGDFELWKSIPPYDSDSTSRVKDINQTPTLLTGSFPQELTDVNGTLFFVAAGNGFTNYELWKSDGTDLGTTMVKDINTTDSDSGSNPSGLTNINGTLLFAANDGTTMGDHGIELWKSEGPDYDAASTQLVEDIAPGGGASSDPQELTKVNGTLFFHGSDAGADFELYKSESPFTSATKINVNPTGSSDPSQLVKIGGQLFFEAGDGVHGGELWKSNGGTVGSGTHLVADINPMASSFPADITGVAGQAFFRANDGVAGQELWKSATPFTSATRVADIQPGPAGSIPEFLTDVNGTLFFRANDGVTGGRELFKATIEGPPPPPPPPTTTPTTPTPLAAPVPAPAAKKGCKKKKKAKKGASAAKKKKCKKKKK
jgi:ELWxxDGT repeat protein